MQKTTHTKYIIISIVIIVYIGLHFFLAEGDIFLKLSNIFFNVGALSLVFALTIELSNRSYFKMFTYPAYFFRKTREISKQRKHNLEQDKLLSLYEYETKDLKKYSNKYFYIVAALATAFSILFALLFQQSSSW